ncbi:MAG: DUF1343 domain-containing protein, partial [Algoriella sp.]
MKNFVKYTSIALLLSIASQSNAQNKSLTEKKVSSTSVVTKPIVVGAENTTNYLSKLKGKKVGVVSNQTG